MKWTVAEARRHFAELLKRAAAEPQAIYNREQPVAAVVDMETFARFEAWQTTQGRRSMADAFAELQQICQEESYSLPLVTRADRDNPFADDLPD